MSIIKEKKLNKFPEIISLESTEILINQMKKNIFKICLKDGTKGTSFFCIIPLNNNGILKVLITNNHVINLEMNKITISINNDSEVKEIELNNRIKYTNKDYDITIIEIKEKDNINNYLEIDENILEKDKNIIYVNNSIYLLQYPKGKKLGVSYGILKEIYEDQKYNFNHLCCTEEGSSGSPIINLTNNKVIGIHKEADKNNNYNRGLFLNYAIEDFINNEKSCLNNNANYSNLLNRNFNNKIKKEEKTNNNLKSGRNNLKNEKKILEKEISELQKQLEKIAIEYEKEKTILKNERDKLMNEIKKLKEQIIELQKLLKNKENNIIKKDKDKEKLLKAFIESENELKKRVNEKITNFNNSK